MFVAKAVPPLASANQLIVSPAVVVAVNVADCPEQIAGDIPVIVAALYLNEAP